MATLYDAEGNEIEALTQEEVDAKIEESTNTAKEELQKQLEEKETELEKLKDKDYNFKKQRDNIDKKNDEIEELKSLIDERLSKFENNINNKNIESEINDLSGGDKDVASKIKYHYDRFAAPKEDEDDTRLDDAFQLATGTSKEDFKPNKINTFGDAHIPINGNKGGKMSDEVKSFGKMFGLTDEDLKGK